MKNATTRRDFLLTGAALTAASSLSFASPASAMGMGDGAGIPGIRLGVASYSLRKFDRSHVIGFMKELNTPLLNAKDVKDHLPITSPDATRQAVADYAAAGIRLTAAGTIYFDKDDDEDVRAKFEYCKTAGVSIIVGAPTHETLARVEKFAKQYDIRVGIHNHGPEDKQWPSPMDVLKAVSGMDAHIGCCIDVGHTERAGTDVVAAIHAAGPRLFDVHMKDLANFHDRDSQVAVGDGIMPVRGIFEALLKIGYKGNVDLEYEIREDDPMPGMIKSFAYMRGVLAGMKIGA